MKLVFTLGLILFLNTVQGKYLSLVSCLWKCKTTALDCYQNADLQMRNLHENMLTSGFLKCSTSLIGCKARCSKDSLPW